MGYELVFTAQKCYYPKRTPCGQLVKTYASYEAVPKSVPTSLAPGVWGARVYSVPHKAGAAKTLELTYNFTVGSLPSPPPPLPPPRPPPPGPHPSPPSPKRRKQRCCLLLPAVRTCRAAAQAAVALLTPFSEVMMMEHACCWDVLCSFIGAWEGARGQRH